MTPYRASAFQRVQNFPHAYGNITDPTGVQKNRAVRLVQAGFRCQKTAPCVIVEGTDLQADITLGNIATALTLHTEEAALIAELRAGSEDAFSWLISRYHQPIYSLLVRTVRDPADAADLTQEVFVKIFRGIGSFHGESSLRTWIYRIALHEGLNQRRWWRRHKEQEVTIETEMVDCESGEPVRLKETLVDSSYSPYEMATQAESRGRVEAALRQVPEPFRMTLILRDIEGFVYEEVAAMLGVNIGTVKSRLVRGRACLRQILIADESQRTSAAHTVLSGTTLPHVAAPHQSSTNNTVLAHAEEGR